MADTKISALPASTTPLAGTEVLPIVQSSATKQVSVANLTAGRSFDALGMTLTSTDAGAAAAPLLELYRDSASPAAADTLGEIEFNGEDSAGNKQAYGLIHASILSPTTTAEQGQLHFETATAGALTEKMIIGTTNLVINEIGAVFNVRIEGDTDANLFYTDATNSRVGVGTISPSSKFEVAGDARVTTGNLIIGTSTQGVTSGNFSLGLGANGSTSAVLIDTSGNLLVGYASGANHYIGKAVAEGADILGVLSTTTNLQTAYFMGVTSAGENAAASAIGVRKNGTTSRSINAGGTINALGTDYAEYMTKAGDFTIAKGDVVGIDAQGKLTNVFADAVSFVVKSSNPSFVGGDVWGNEEALGLTRPTSESTQAEKDAFDSALEIARQRVDRIAFSGQVPVNVMGATAGQYIVPVNDNGAIKGEAVSNPTFEQYQISVGKVISIESDGRAKIIVKVA
jgi:hypothetical protein